MDGIVWVLDGSVWVLDGIVECWCLGGECVSVLYRGVGVWLRVCEC